MNRYDPNRFPVVLHGTAAAWLFTSGREGSPSPGLLPKKAVKELPYDSNRVIAVWTY
jgi:hypothetical protein